MPQVIVTTDLRNVDKFLTRAQKRLIPSVSSQALNEAARGVRTDVAIGIRNETSIKASAVGTRFTSKGGLVVTKKARPNTLIAEITGSRNTSPFSQFKTGFKRRTSSREQMVTVTINRKKKIIKRAFKVSGGNVKASGRYQKDFVPSGGGRNALGRFVREPTITLKTLSIGSQINKRYVDQIADNQFGVRFNKSFNRIFRNRLGI